MRAQIASIPSLCKAHLQSQLHQIVRAVKRQSTKQCLSVEPVHHLRTEIRRINVGFQLLVDDLPREDVFKIQRQLERIRKRAGSVRDLDVLRPLLMAATRELPDATCKWLRHRLNRRRKKAAYRLKDECKRTQSHRLRQHIHTLKHSRSHAKTDLIRAAFRDLVGKVFSTATLADSNGNHLHTLRKALRNARYAIEAIEWPDCPSTAERLRSELTHFQDALGAVNDRTEFSAFLMAAKPSSADRIRRDQIELTARHLQQETTSAAETAIHQVCRRIASLAPAFTLLIQQRLK